uniref:Uncharacterized protein n=1 Tax=Rhodosorus marinus TaxID=101924 RepID=A0A7S0BV83_9RHOD|mmetsp:Transcript_9275/g.13556  ORF Transcript_9275/g.13556 Transcript_9275/m.13556 type:complete len:202 (+) Transcript_9275:63-668(+)
MVFNNKYEKTNLTGGDFLTSETRQFMRFASLVSELCSDFLSTSDLLVPLGSITDKDTRVDAIGYLPEPDSYWLVVPAPELARVISLGPSFRLALRSSAQNRPRVRTEANSARGDRFFDLGISGGDAAQANCMINYGQAIVIELVLLQACIWRGLRRDNVEFLRRFRTREYGLFLIHARSEFLDQTNPCEEGHSRSREDFHC